MAKVVRYLLLVREYEVHNPKPIKFPTRCHYCCSLEMWTLAKFRGDTGHRSLMTSERMVNKCNEDFIVFFYFGIFMNVV